MTKAEAIKAIKRGLRVTHTLFTEDEWLEMDGGWFKFEDGCQCRPSQFWDIRQGEEWEKGWRVVDA